MSAGLWLTGLAVALSWVFLHASVRNDMTSFMPRAATPVQRLLLNELRVGPVARLMLITLTGAPRERLAQVSKQVAARLRASELFVRVANGEQAFDAAEQARLFSYRYLLSPGVHPGSLGFDALRAALQARLHELASPLPGFDRRWLARDPSAEMRTLLNSWQGLLQPNRYRGVWFDGDGQQALLLAQTSAAGFDIDAQERAQQAVRQVVADVGGGVIELGLSGPGVFAVSSRDLIRADSRRLGILAGAAMTLILLAAYRSLRLLLVGALPLLSAVTAGVVAVELVFGAIHGIVLAFGVTVIGVAIDYPIHLFSHLHPGEAARQCLARIWPTIRLGAITTAMGYLAMVGTDFPGLMQFATFAVAGLLAAAACTRWALVGLLPATSGPRRASAMAAWYARCPPAGIGWQGLTLAIGVLAMAYLASRDSSPWEDDIAALSPIAESQMARDRHLHAPLGVPDTNHVILVRGAHAQAALQASEALAGGLRRLVAEGAIDSFDFPARYLPSIRTQQERQRALPDAARLHADLEQALIGLPFKAGAFAPFEEDVAVARALPPLEPTDLDGTALGVRLRSSLLALEGEWLALVTLAGVADSQALQALLSQQPPGELYYLDLKRDTRGLMTDFRRHAASRVLWGVLGIVAVLALGLRSARRTLRVLLPGLLAVIVAVTVLRLGGERLSLFHLVSLLLVVGLSIDYGLFFSRADADPGMRGRTFHGLVVCMLSTVTVFGILSTSQLPVLDAIGTTVALGVAVSFLAAMLLARPAERTDGPSETT